MACNQEGYPVLIGKQHWVSFLVRHDYFVNPSSNPDYPLVVYKRAQCLEISILHLPLQILLGTSDL